MGADVHRELGHLVAAVLSTADALRAATLSPAEYPGREHRSVVEDKVADLVLLDADLLVDIARTQRIWSVVFGGHVYDRAALDEIQSVVRGLQDPVALRQEPGTL